MVAADEHLRAVAARYLGDPDMGDAARVVSRVRHLLGTTWVPAIERVLTSEALNIRRTGHPDGWMRLPDPLGPSVTVERAPALAAELTLHGATPTQLVDLLAGIARNPAAGAAFRAELTAHDWGRLIDEVGLAHLTAAHLAVDDIGNPELQGQLALLDDAAALLALLLRGRPDGHRPWRPDVLAHADPYAAALIVRHLRLDATVLAETADRLLLRSYEGHPNGDRYADGYRSGPNAGDLLFPLLIAEPAAATAFLQRAAQHPAVVFMSAQDQRLVRDLLRTGTAPTRVSSRSAGTILPPLLRWAADARRRVQPHDGGTPDASAFLAEASAPWLLQFGRRADEWGWTGPEADQAVRNLIDDERAMEHLIGAMGTWRRTLAATPLTRVDGRVDLDTLLDLSTMFAQLQLAFRDEEVTDDAEARFWLEVTLFTGTLVASAAITGGFLASVGTGLALDAANATAAAALGRFGVATSADRSRHEAAARFGSRNADVAVIAVVSVVARLVAERHLPADTLDRLHLPTGGAGCSPIVVAERLATFVATLEPFTDPSTFNAITTVMTAFINPSSARQACA